jgi:hypothetical protein
MLSEPFVTMNQALSDGRVCVYCLGFTLDAFTPCADLLTVAVFEPELYDDLFSESVDTNGEGAIPVTTARAIHRLPAVSRQFPQPRLVEGRGLRSIDVRNHWVDLV